MKTNDHEGVTNFRFGKLYIPIRIQPEGVTYFGHPDTKHFLSRDFTPEMILKMFLQSRICPPLPRKARDIFSPRSVTPLSTPGG